ncbi:unnamed protein product [Adineta ricciae]|uniref:PDZ domain-containing protein n=1 Tax=Adineta ricciae TaxID=249248 RepID=A0A815UIC0_ADIRI|nr:unnamed protein product [Adineta ricciae]
MNAAEDDDYQSIGSELPLDEETSSVSPHNYDQTTIVVKDSEINGQQSSLMMLHGEIPVSELSEHDYEIHKINLIQPTETVPLGFKLSKQTDTSQCIVSCIDRNSKAEQAGLQVGDWLIEIDGKDIRSTEFSDISQLIREKLNVNVSIDILVARKKSHSPLSLTNDDQRPSTVTAYDMPKQANVLLSVGLSNKIEEKPADNVVASSNDTDKESIRHIVLKDAFDIDFCSFAPDKNSPLKIHAINNIRPLSPAYRAGLRNGDRILTINDVAVANTNHKTVRHWLLEKSPVYLTVINDPNYLDFIENVKSSQNRISLSRQSSTYEAVEEQPPPDVISDDLINVLFIDDQGPVYMKHCILKKEPTHQSLGFAVRDIDNLHVIRDVDDTMSAYNYGIRDEDVILYVNRQNVERMTHDDVKILIRKFSISNEFFHLILIKKADVQRYKDYKEKSFIDWKRILTDIREDQTQGSERKYANIQPLQLGAESSSSSISRRTRHCILKPSMGNPAGFSISGEDKGPFIISKIDKDSPGELAGLQISDILLSIDGKSLLHATYDETIQTIKQALTKPSVDIVVKQSSDPKRRESSESSSSDASDDSVVGYLPTPDTPAQVYFSETNPIQAYQSQRTRELAYTLRLCHLHATNPDGSPAPTFGFDITKEAKYEYPIISRIDARSPAERGGLQTRDLLLKVNDRKTKGVDINKVRRHVDKAKHDNRLELLVVDEEVYRYCTSTNRKFKEPYIKVKHIFPKNRASANVESLDSLAARSSNASEDIVKQLKSGPEFKVHRLSISKDTLVEDEENAPKIRPKPMKKSTSMKEVTKQSSKDESMVDSVLKSFHNYFHNFDTDKISKLEYDVPSQQPTDPQTSGLLLPATVHVNRNLSEEMSYVSRLYQAACSNRSSGLYDYIRDPRQCILKIDRTKGLGFVLTATGDYDHTITSVEKNSIADIAGLQTNDELIEINGIDVRNIKYEDVVQMLLTAIQTQDTLEMCVSNSHSNDFYPSIKETTRDDNTRETMVSTAHETSVLSDIISSKNSPVHSPKLPTTNTSHSDLYDNAQHLTNTIHRVRSESISQLSTGITASPKDIRSTSTTSTSSKKHAMDSISKRDAPIARLCRIRKFPSSPFYGFFLCGNPKRLGRVYVSNIKKHSSAAICGLRNGDRIIEVNGVNIQTLTYETILNKIKLHLEHRDLELLVLDKKSLRWYRDREYPVSSQTLPTIVQIEPMINDINIGKQESITQRKISSFIGNNPSVFE